MARTTNHALTLAHCFLVKQSIWRSYRAVSSITHCYSMVNRFEAVGLLGKEGKTLVTFFCGKAKA
jgi:hypothetical protein